MNSKILDAGTDWYCPLADTICRNGTVSKFGIKYSCINREVINREDKTLYYCEYFKKRFT